MGLENNIRYFYKLENKLLKYFPDGSVVKTEKGLVSIFQEDSETYLIHLDSGEISTKPEQYIKLGLTPENLSELLSSWFSDNRFLGIKVAGFSFEGTRWISEQLMVKGIKIQRPIGYSSASLYSDYTGIVPILYMSDEKDCNLCDLDKIIELFIPTEEDIKYFKDMYYPPSETRRLISP